MNHSKEDAPVAAEDLRLVDIKNLNDVFNRADVPTPLREKITRGLVVLSAEEIVGILFDNLPEDKRAELERKGVEGLEEEIRKKVEEDIGHLFDEYLGEVTRGTFGFNLGEISAQERMQIESIRTQLKIPGEFNPDA